MWCAGWPRSTSGGAIVHPVIAAIPGVTRPEPEGGFYLFPDVSRWLSREVPDTVALCGRLLEEKAVAVVPGEGFHAPGCFRLSFATAIGDLPEGGAADRRVPRGASSPARRADVKPRGFEPGTPVLLYLHSPREKVFGILVALQPAGVAVRGIELAAFEDFLRQEARGEKGLGLVTLFYP